MNEQAYARDLLQGYVAEIKGELDSAGFYYKNCVTRELTGTQNYFSYLDLARISLKAGDMKYAEQYLEIYLDTLYFQIVGCDLGWGGGTPDKLIRFYEDHSLYIGTQSQDDCGYILKEYRILKNVLTELKNLNESFFIVPEERELQESLRIEGEKFADAVINKNISELLKYVDNDKWRVACGLDNSLSVDELETELRDSIGTVYCHLFGGDAFKGKSKREYLVEAKKKNFRIKTEIFDDGYLLSPLGFLIYEWDEKPDFLASTDFPTPYFIYTKHGWKILNLFIW
jgi:hypothetical protein